MSPEDFFTTIVRDPTSAEIAEFLAGRSAAQMLQLMRCIKEPAARVAFATQMLNLPTPMSGLHATPEKAQKAKKAVNAFVGFRCYYISIPVFKSSPMKKLSNLIGILWDADPNKPLWSLMTKAWSMIRDQLTKQVAPLDEFFELVCPWLGIPSPALYLETYGWTLSVDQDGNLTLSCEAGFESTFVVAGAADKALSVEDIIGFVQGRGYGMDYVHNPDASSTFLAERMAARRANRTAAEELAFQAKIQADIHAVHEYMQSSNDGPILDTPNYSATLPNGEHNPLYDQIHTAVTEGIPDFNGTAPTVGMGAGVTEGISDLDDSAPTFDMGTGVADPSIPFSTSEDFHQSTSDNAPLYDNDAFRVGANEDATLPTFDGANNA
uniref:Mating-type protein MAT-1 n=1 Tax=Pyrenophora graminea TaxID=5028 RepID=A5XB77_PYRGR|nr:MAT-1 [Pyrenophora graminea]